MLVIIGWSSTTIKFIYHHLSPAQGLIKNKKLAYHDFTYLYVVFILHVVVLCKLSLYC